jgi:predicted small lipoprotein YifL
MRSSLILCGMLALVAACGTKGPLTKPPPAAASAPSTPVAAPADDSSKPDQPAP